MAQGGQILTPKFDTGTGKLFVGDGNDYPDIVNFNQVDGLVGYKSDPLSGGIGISAGDEVLLDADEFEVLREIAAGGSITASVQPRSGLLADLLALDGLAGEWSYPTDAPGVAVRHNGVAGGAVKFVQQGGGRDIFINLDGPGYSDGGPVYIPGDVRFITFSGTASGNGVEFNNTAYHGQIVTLSHEGDGGTLSIEDGSGVSKTIEAGQGAVVIAGGYLSYATVIGIFTG